MLIVRAGKVLAADVFSLGLRAQATDADIEKKVGIAYLPSFLVQ